MVTSPSLSDHGSSGLRVPEYRDWRAAMADSVTDPLELCRLLRLPDALAARAADARRAFSLVVPKPYLARIRPGDPLDPLLRQILPQAEELAADPRFTIDPLGETSATRGGSVLWKYDSRLLIVTTGVCAVHCRFCFRRHFPYHMGTRPAMRWDDVLQTVESEPSIREVILSGGDPLSLDDHFLADFSRRLAAIREHMQE